MAVTLQIIGYKKSGKTTVTAALTQALHTKGLRVSVIKHDAHDAAMDVAGTDTARFAASGADSVILQSANGLFYHQSQPQDVSAPALIDWLPDDVDVILIEGFKPAPYPKLVLLRPEDHLADFAKFSNVIQTASLNNYPAATLTGVAAITTWFFTDWLPLAQE